MQTPDLFDDNSAALVAGVDEVGRGPLAGDVVAAAVILNGAAPSGVTDSKALSAGRREALAEVIRESALCWSVGRASVAEIDELNIGHFLIGESIFIGLPAAIARMRQFIQSART